MRVRIRSRAQYRRGAFKRDPRHPSLRPQHAGYVRFRLLSVVRRRFPAIKVIAMSGACLGEGVPPGVAADAFYEKGTNLGSLLQIIEAMARSDRQLDSQHSSLMAPIWIPRNGHDSSSRARSRSASTALANEELDAGHLIRKRDQLWARLQ